jgi:hypothetical protein
MNEVEKSVRYFEYMSVDEDYLVKMCFNGPLQW